MRLIDADYFDKMLIDAQQKCAGRNNTFKYGFLSTVRANLERCPSVDAVPVRHGRWIPEPDRHYHWHCSECGFVEGFRAKINKYCPNCGAQMEWSEKDE